MYMTKMALNAGRPGTTRLLSSPQRMHAAVLHGFPPTDAGRVLWRVDARERHDVSLFVVSTEHPDMTSLVEQAGWPARPDATWEAKAYGPFLDRLAAGQRWAFRLRANPVIRRRENDRTQTIPLLPKDQLAWLTGRAESLGVAFPHGTDDRPNIEITEQGRHVFDRRSAAQGHGRRVTIAHARYDGVLEVSDPARLQKALIQGVGRAKAYGCGLLTLAQPAP
ncbi:type I-E CRISPR-associated protein Cas6/Cse3/CasE [Aeromicrobium sp. CTD01-1L150]|uniref:type I-E CRISPR-associated protein Cas6/Cse3/CasE n=1 Tax=Aeromicrobium sp. CTD01-1L150 TaxID=3341830 RepID=UPI0035C131F5